MDTKETNLIKEYFERHIAVLKEHFDHRIELVIKQLVDFKKRRSVFSKRMPAS